MKFFGFVAIVLAALLTACAQTIPQETIAEPAPAPQTQVGNAAPASPVTLQKIVWAWQNTQQSGAWFAPANPARYTLIFREENRVAVAADCNRGGTVYHLDGDRLTFDPIAMTKMLCSADSLDRGFLDALHAVDHYRIDDNTLTLQLRQGGQMVFAPIQP
ncbi:MAG: META domain-containing protein [Betaproteobacteria bacterium]|nr:META domain-containing protein [Betaproteobacteria bacterium]